nr:MAG TPA: hypothetical protein [Caudoviricetes sp.]
MPLVSNAINLGEPWAGSQDTPAAPLWHLLEMGGYAVRIGFLDNGYLHAAERISIQTPPRVSNTPITLRFYAGEYLNNVVPTSDTRLIEIGTGTFTDATATVQVPAWRSGHNRTMQFFVTVDNPRDLRWAPEGGYVITVHRTAEPQKGPTQTVTPAGTTPALDFGVARLGAGAVTLRPSAVDPQHALGQPTLRAGAVRITVGGIPATAQYGTHALSSGAVTVRPSGLTPTADFGAARLHAGSVTIGVTGFGGADLGTPLLSAGGAVVAPPGVTNDPSFGGARLSAGAVTIRPTGLAPTFEVGPPVVSTGGAVVSVVGIASSVTVGDPVITGRRPVARTISPRSVAPQLEFGRLRFTQGKAGPRTLGVQGIDSANTFGSAVAYGLAPYSPYVVTSSIPSRTSFGNYASIRLASQPQLPPGADPLERVIMANIASVRTAQEVLTVEIPIDLTKDTYTDPATGVQKPIAEGTPASGVALVKLPRGARILGGGVVTTTAITDTAAKVSLKLFEPKTNTAIFNGDDIKSAGNRPIAGAGVFFEDTPVQFALTATKITAGQIIVSLQFAVRDRADYNLGGV